MEDTSAEVMAEQQRIWMSLSEEERFRKGAELFEIAREFARQRAPKGLDEAGIKRFVFKELYGFDPPQLESEKLL
jgi:hypothetical protein